MKQIYKKEKPPIKEASQGEDVRLS